MSDLVIGTRRPPSARRNLRAVAIGLLALLVALLVAYVIFRRVVSYIVPEGSVPSSRLEVITDDGSGATSLAFGESSVSYSGRIAVLRLVGKPHTLGAAHGRLLGESVSRVAETLAPAISATVSTDGLLGGSTHDARLRWRHRLLDDGIPGHQLLEIIGVVRGARKTAGSAPSYESFVRQQAVLDIGTAPSASDGHRFRTVARSLSFVATLRGTSGDRLLIGRSFGLPGAADGGVAAARELTVTIARDPSGDMIPFASVGWPGLVGVVSGINAESIAVMVHPARTADVRVTREAQPIPLLAREILEQARTIDDAIAILEHAEPLGAAAFLVVDGNARSWAVVDRTPDDVAVSRGRTPPVVTDLLLADSLEEDPENDRARRFRPAARRAARVAQLLRQRISQPTDVAAILRDTRAPDDAPLPAGHRGAIHDLAAVHSAIFDASGMVLWVSEGPGAAGRFRAFDLRYELRREGARPAPPSDIPAASDFDAGAADAVLAARADLRLARAAWSAGKRTRARELVQRALARSPSLPEALRLAGEYARQSGDRDNADVFFRRYLTVGPDDLAAEEEVEAFLENR